MSKFLDLVEQFDPQNTEDPKWKLIDFLKSKGVNVSMVRDTDMLYIDTGSDTIAVTISSNSEDAESINAGTGTYEIDKEVEGLADKASSGLSGLAGKAIGSSAQKAKTSVKKRQNIARQAVDAYDNGTKRIENGLKLVKQQGIIPKY